jgi:hypothetical protein
MSGRGESGARVRVRARIKVGVSLSLRDWIAMNHENEDRFSERIQLS